MKIFNNIQKIYGEKELREKLESDKKLKVYFGVDPSGDRLHLGHAVALWKLLDFQKAGHGVTLLIGDFTGMIGDPTDKLATRKPLTREEVLKNAEDYKKQVGKILKFDGENPVRIEYNSKWLDPLTFKDLIELAANFSVQRLLERDMFEKRIKEEKVIHLHEFLYPLMQGYDAVMLDVDLQVGGNDQTFNMLAGRTLMRKLKDKEMSVISLPILVGLDGQKMSKSFQNTIEIDTNPADMFGKVMSMKDELIADYFRLAAMAEDFEVEEVKKELKMGENPRDIKARLAQMIVKRYHGEEAAVKAESEFNLVFKEKGMPSEMPEVKMAAGKSENLPGLLVDLKLATSKSDARRLIEQGAVRIDEAVISDITAGPCIHDGMVVQVGKRKFVRIICR